MQIVGVCGRKGGSGKTTIAIHLASEMASRGLSVILVDCDLQASATHWSAPALLPMPVLPLPLGTGQNITRWSDQIRAQPAQYLVLDAPPHLDAAMGGIIGLSDVAALPCGPSGLDLLATADTVRLIHEIRAARGQPTMPAITLIPNRVDLRTSSGRQLSSALEGLGENVAPAVHARTALSDAFNLGAWVGAYAPQGAAHLEIQALSDHILTLLGHKPRKRAS